MRYLILVGQMKKSFNKMKLAYPVNEGLVIFSKDKTSVKVFASYDRCLTTKEILGDRTNDTNAVDC